MTAQEALSLLNDMEFDKKYQGKQEYAEMLLVCKEALEKQMAKKPLPHKGWEGKCPTCGVIFLDRTTNYCGNCGQALDWSDTNV